MTFKRRIPWFLISIFLMPALGEEAVAVPGAGILLEAQLGLAIGQSGRRGGQSRSRGRGRTSRQAPKKARNKPTIYPTNKLSAPGAKAKGARAAAGSLLGEPGLSPDGNSDLERLLLERLQDENLSRDARLQAAKVLKLSPEAIQRLLGNGPAPEPQSTIVADPRTELEALISQLSGGVFPLPEADPEVLEVERPSLSVTRLADWFEGLDPNGDKSVSFLEFRDRTRGSIGLYRLFDREQDGVVKFSEFAETLVLTAKHMSIPLEEALFTWAASESDIDWNDSPFTPSVNESAITQTDMLVARAKFYVSDGKDDPYAPLRKKLEEQWLKPDARLPSELENPNPLRDQHITVDEASSIAHRLFPLPDPPEEGEEEVKADWGEPGIADQWRGGHVTATSQPTLDQLIERGRRTLFGYLGPFILHETNNVLTVMSGIRQLMRMSRELPEKVGPMIDSQLHKVEQLLEWIRGLSPESSGTPCTSDQLLENLEQLTRLAMKGRRVEISSEVRGNAQPELSLVEPAALAVLCCLLPLFPGRQAGTARVALTASGDEGIQLTARLDAAHADPLSCEEVLLARDLVERAGLQVSMSGGLGKEFLVEIGSPAAQV